MADTPRYMQEAIDLVERETAFHLGFRPTEQASPLTRDIDRIFAADTQDGIRTLLSVDDNVAAMAEKMLRSDEFRELVKRVFTALQNGGKLVFSGCGATGRLAIILEGMWRRYCLEHPESQVSAYADAVFSIMTGGDYALIRSVEFFEDYPEFGRQQLSGSLYRTVQSSSGNAAGKKYLARAAGLGQARPSRLKLNER